MGAGFESTIDIYLRVRPIASGTTALFELNQEEGLVTWTIPRHVSLGMVNHQREHYTFKFSGMFDVESKQDEVFQKVAHKVETLATPRLICLGQRAASLLRTDCPLCINRIVSFDLLVLGLSRVQISLESIRLSV